MSKIKELEKTLKTHMENIDTEQLTMNANNKRYFHDNVIPLINEVVMSASGKDNYEEAYKAVIDKLRSVHQKVVKEKQDSEAILMKSVGQKELITAILPSISEIVAGEEAAEKLEYERRQEEKITEIAEKIQSGELNTERPRKIGTRPESMKNIRTAKATLFGGTQNKDQEQD